MHKKLMSCYSGTFAPALFLNGFSNSLGEMTCTLGVDCVCVVNTNKNINQLSPLLIPKFSDFCEDMCRDLDAVPPGRDEKRRHTDGYVEAFRKPLMRKKLVQIK
jgi:hypothetical protein